MPTTAKQLRSQLGLSNKTYGYIPETITNMLPTWHKIGKPSPLFTKIEDQTVEMLRKKYAGQQETNGKISETGKESANKTSEKSKEQPVKTSDTSKESASSNVAVLEAAIMKQVSKSLKKKR